MHTQEHASAGSMCPPHVVKHLAAAIPVVQLQHAAVEFPTKNHLLIYLSRPAVRYVIVKVLNDQPMNNRM